MRKRKTEKPPASSSESPRVVVLESSNPLGAIRAVMDVFVESGSMLANGIARVKAESEGVPVEEAFESLHAATTKRAAGIVKSLGDLPVGIALLAAMEASEMCLRVYEEIIVAVAEAGEVLGQPRTADTESLSAMRGHDASH